jgi:hypothetical protein
MHPIFALKFSRHVVSEGAMPPVANSIRLPFTRQGTITQFATRHLFVLSYIRALRLVPNLVPLSFARAGSFGD